MSFGLSFIPTGNPTREQTDPTRGATPQLQTAIRLLSLKLPRFGGAQGLAPQPLLHSQGGSALGADGSLEALLRSKFGIGGPAGPGLDLTQLASQFGSGPTSLPMPRIIPKGDGWSDPGIPRPPSVPSPGRDFVIDRTNPSPGNRGSGAPRFQMYGRMPRYGG